MWKRMILMLVCVAVFIVAIGFWKYRLIQAGMAMGKKFAPPPAAVTTLKVQPQTWQPVLNAIGSMKAVNGVTVSTDLAGIVSEIAFESGTQVRKGDLLVTLETKQEEAQLRSADERLKLAKTDLERKRDLVASKAISKSEWDAAESQLRQMEASVEEMKALVARKRIVAPFDGFIGIRQVNIGQYINPGAPIVPLESLDPIYVEFSVPQQNLGDIEVGRKLKLRASGVAGAEFDGAINAINSHVDESTRSVVVQGTVKNPDHKLRPGMFVDVDVLLPTKEGVLAIPSSSIAYAPYGDSVYIIRDKPGPDGKPVKQAEKKIVKLGSKRGDQVTVLTGVMEGDEVVTSGVFKLRPDAPVNINNEVQPGNELNPQPPET